MRSVTQAIRSANRKAKATLPFCSHWQTTVFPRKGKKRKGPWRHNLTTTTASGYTNALDWLAKLMGVGPNFTFATAAGAATASGANSLTNSGAAFPTAGQGLAGQYVVAATAGGALVYGVIVSNTATVLTVDQWYNVTSTSGASGTTPSATGQYVIMPGQAAASWMAVTSDATSPTTADTTLTSEATTNGFARAVGTYSHTAAATTYALVHLWTATGSLTVNKEAQFGACNPTGGGVMPFESAEPTPPSLLSGDTLQNTVTITI